METQTQQIVNLEGIVAATKEQLSLARIGDISTAERATETEPEPEPAPRAEPSLETVPEEGSEDETDPHELEEIAATVREMASM